MAPVQRRLRGRQFAVAPVEPGPLGVEPLLALGEPLLAALEVALELVHLLPQRSGVVLEAPHLVLGGLPGLERGGTGVVLGSAADLRRLVFRLRPDGLGVDRGNGCGAISGEALEPTEQDGEQDESEQYGEGSDRDESVHGTPPPCVHGHPAALRAGSHQRVRHAVCAQGGTPPGGSHQLSRPEPSVSSR